MKPHAQPSEHSLPKPARLATLVSSLLKIGSFRSSTKIIPEVPRPNEDLNLAMVEQETTQMPVKAIIAEVHEQASVDDLLDHDEQKIAEEIDILMVDENDHLSEAENLESSHHLPYESMDHTQEYKQEQLVSVESLPQENLTAQEFLPVESSNELLPALVLPLKLSSFAAVYQKLPKEGKLVSHIKFIHYFAVLLQAVHRDIITYFPTQGETKKSYAKREFFAQTIECARWLNTHNDLATQPKAWEKHEFKKIPKKLHEFYANLHKDGLPKHPDHMVIDSERALFTLCLHRFLLTHIATLRIYDPFYIDISASLAVEEMLKTESDFLETRAAMAYEKITLYIKKKSPWYFKQGLYSTFDFISKMLCTMQKIESYFTETPFRTFSAVVARTQEEADSNASMYDRKGEINNEFSTKLTHILMNLSASAPSRDLFVVWAGIDTECRTVSCFVDMSRNSRGCNLADGTKCMGGGRSAISA